MKSTPLLLTVLLAFAGASTTSAQTLITAADIVYSEDFASFEGTAATLPSQFVFTPAVVGLTYNGFYNLDGTYSNLNRVVALRESASSADRAFGLKSSASGTSTLDWTFQNATGTAITSLSIGWDFLQYTESGRASTLSFQYSVDGGAYTTLGILTIPPTTSTTSTASTRLPGASTGGGNLEAAYREVKDITLTLPSELEDGQEITLRWNISSGALIGDSNNNAYIGVDNLRVSATAAVPEPTTYLLLGASMLLMLRRCGRIRQE